MYLEWNENFIVKVKGLSKWQSLIFEAQELLKKAKSIEEKKFKIAGQLVYEYYKKDFADFDMEQFKTEVKEAFNTDFHRWENCHNQSLISVYYFYFQLIFSSECSIEITFNINDI